MRALLEKLLSSTYEALGIVVPGTVFLGLLVALLTTAFASLDAWDQFAPVARWFMAGGETLAGAVCIGFLGYLFGQLLKWTAKGPLRPSSAVQSKSDEDYSAWRNLFLFQGKTPPKELSRSGATLLAQVESKLGLHSSSNRTALSRSTKIQILRAHHHQTIGRGLFDDFQDKYTFHRSIASAAALLVWLTALFAALGTLYILFSEANVPIWRVLLLGAPGLIFVALFVAFSRSYQYYWKLFSESLVSEVWASMHPPSLTADSASDRACSE